MEEIASGIRVHEKEPEQSVIQDIQFKFGPKVCNITITVSGHPPQKFKIKYEEDKFQTLLEKPLKELGLKLLDLASVNNLYQIKLIDQLLVKCLKKAMQQIHRFSAQKVFDTAPGEKSIQALVSQANTEATEILKEIEEKFLKINACIEEAQMEVYDRSPLIKKAKEEIIDNLNRKYILIVNQLIELQRGNALPTFHLAGQIDTLINNL